MMPLLSKAEEDVAVPRMLMVNSRAPPLTGNTKLNWSTGWQACEFSSLSFSVSLLDADDK